MPALLFALAGVIALMLATISAKGAPGQYLVLTAPWSGRAQMMDMVSQADGGVVGFGVVPFLAVAMAGRPDFGDAMRDQGAWLVLPSPILLGCFVDKKEERP